MSENAAVFFAMIVTTSRVAGVAGAVVVGGAAPLERPERLEKKLQTVISLLPRVETSRFIIAMLFFSLTVRGKKQRVECGL